MSSRTDKTPSSTFPPISEKPSPESLATDIKQYARTLGFDLCAIVPVDEAPNASFFKKWLADGRAGEMSYLERNVDKREQPALLAEEGSAAYRSLIVLGVNYYQYSLPPETLSDPSRGIIASYAWSDDYHEIIRPLLYDIDAYIRSRTGRTEKGKCLVDTGPVLERDWAQRAGIGFTGKNCCTIRPGMGSWLFLATILVPEKLNYDQLFGVTQERQQQDDVGRMVRSVSSIGTCGSCTRCLIACPTDAILAPYDLDPRRCISYWTIEAKGSIPRELRPLFANRIFGCDICQEVCPYNQRLPERTPLLQGLHAKQEQTTLPLLEGFNPAFPYWLDEAAFRQRFRGSPIRRAKRKGMLRNVCVALGNWGSPTATPALTVALSDPEDIVRGHAAWALGRVASSHQDHRCIRALATAGLTEMNDWVRSEIAAALSSVRI